MKQCTKCLENKPVSKKFFYQRKCGSFEACCIACAKKRSNEDYLKNRRDRMKTSLSRREIKQNEARVYILDFLKYNPCIDCNESNILTLEFDHIDPASKKHTISFMVMQGYLLEKIKLEIEKCEVRCSNCHKIKTAKQQSWYKYIFLENNKNE